MQPSPFLTIREYAHGEDVLVLGEVGQRHVW